MQLFFSGFERKARRFAQRVLGALFHLRRAAPFQIGQVNRILLVRTDKIGDAIVSTPVLQALRQHYPNARIDVVLGRRNRAAGPLLPFKDQNPGSRTRCAEDAVIDPQIASGAL